MHADLGRFLLILGLVLVAVGLLLVFADRVPLIGRLPGDFVIRRRGFTLYFPLATGILLSLVLTLLLNLFSRK